MLTGLVNIAVFAAFRFCVGRLLLSTAEFKPFCGPHPLDILRYGWQRRQETATIWQGGRQKRHDLAELAGPPRRQGMGCQWVRAACLAR